jgi:hypothetical protein
VWCFRFERGGKGWKDTFLDACAEIGQLFELGQLGRVRRVGERCEEFFVELLSNGGVP